MLLALLSSSSATISSNNNRTTSEGEATLDAVQCSPNKKEFVAETEFILDGSEDIGFLDSAQRQALTTAFLQIYNRLSQQNCDLYFRRLSALDFISMRDPFRNQTILAGDTDALTFLEIDPPTVDGPPEDAPPLPPVLDEETSVPLPPLPPSLPSGGGPFGGPFRGRLRRQRNLGTTAQGVNGTTTTSTKTTNEQMMTYNVTGTCRGCPITAAGSFELYDDSFRLRHRNLNLRVRIRMRILQVEALPPMPLLLELDEGGDAPPSLLDIDDENNSDCTCQAGLQPSTAQAPKVTELLETINQNLDLLQSEQGIFFPDVRLSNILQL